MRILQINCVCGIGSTGRIATDLHAILETRGHEGAIAFGRLHGIGCSRTIEIGHRLGKFMHLLRTRILDDHGFGSAADTGEFLRQVDAFSPDLIHLHNIHGYFLHVGMLFDYLKATGKPVIWTLHDCWPFTGHCSHFDLHGCDRWVKGCYECPLKDQYPASLFLDRSRENYNKKQQLFSGVKDLTIVTPSRWLGGLVNRSFLNQYEIRTINNGIDIDLFKIRPSRFREDHGLDSKFIILGVSSLWTEKKGFRYFLRLAEKLKYNEIIILVGVTERQQKGLPPNILGIPRTHDSQELAELYSASDVYLNATLEDNFPTTNIEALACGTPVITFQSGGSAECIEAESGLVVERGNLDGLLEAIATVQRLGKAHYSRACRRSAEAFYNKDERFLDYVSLYERDRAPG
jgi:glycosyltransferase involved in cell wall biosynthesis